jgi:hypothetical protein
LNNATLSKRCSEHCFTVYRLELKPYCLIISDAR